MFGADPQQIIREAWDQHGHRIIRRTAMLSGGNDSATLAHWLAWHGYVDELLFLDTGIGIAETHQFVHQFAKYLGLPLEEWHAPPGAYERMIVTITGGFPGPAAHSIAYQRLKERPLNDYIAHCKRGQHWRSKVLLFSGIRRAESAKRMKIAEKAVDPDGGKLWVAPFLDWTMADLGVWREEHDIPHNDVADLLHYSGECLCGANASEGELDLIQRFFPVSAREIHRLQRLAEWLGIERSRWGEHFYETASDTGPACGDCQMRLAGLADCKVPILNAKRRVRVHSYGQPELVRITARIHTPGRQPGPVAHEVHQVPFVELGAAGVYLGPTRVAGFEQSETCKLLLTTPNGPPTPAGELLDTSHGDRQTALDLTCRCDCKRIRGRLPASCTHQPGLAVWVLSEPMAPLTPGIAEPEHETIFARMGIMDKLQLTRGPIRVTNGNGRRTFDRIRVIDRVLLLQDYISARLVLFGDDPEGPLGQFGVWKVPGMGVFRSVLIGREKDAQRIEGHWRANGIEPGYRLASIDPDYYEAVTVAPRYPGDPQERELLNALPADLWTPEDPTPERAGPRRSKPHMVSPSALRARAQRVA
jgi:3'-phosphoadenosine 5'-phosphosulfate sulfotransferase (PAPS reductase)/FAD synthetase